MAERDLQLFVVTKRQAFAYNQIGEAVSLLEISGMAQSTKSSNVILDEITIQRKLDRIAYEIFENNLEEKEIILIGIKNNGYRIAQQLKEKLSDISKLKITFASLSLDKRNPTSKAIELDIDVSSVKNKSVVIVDDVAHSGKTLLYAMKPLLEHTPSKIQIAVLVDRKHKRFPVTADFVGLLLSTGAHEQVILEMDKGTYAYLS